MRWSILLLGLLVTGCAGTASQGAPVQVPTFQGLPTGADTGSAR